MNAITLSRAFVARDGAPVVRAVDEAIFTRRYFGHCMSCGFCADWCCSHGVDVSLRERDRILARAEEIELAVRVPRAEWFIDVVTEDADFPGGAATRTAVVDGACVFLQRAGRGCTLHALALATGQDYHAIKPMVSTLFPVTFGDGKLLCSEELMDGSLVCGGTGPTAYEMARSELAHYFGEELVEELDRYAAEHGNTLYEIGVRARGQSPGQSRGSDPGL